MLEEEDKRENLLCAAFFGVVPFCLTLVAAFGQWFDFRTYFTLTSTSSVIYAAGKSYYIDNVVDFCDCVDNNGGAECAPLLVNQDYWDDACDVVDPVYGACDPLVPRVHEDLA